MPFTSLNIKLNILPSVTTKDCKHLVIDAGHISIESDLADKAAVREIHMKRNQRYSDDDYKRLESLMYDKLSLKLKDAQVMRDISFPSLVIYSFIPQFVIGNDLQSCREALTADVGDNLHLLERISIDLQVQNSIVPTAYSLARFKISGNLPSLKVNVSDTKYKSLMRLIDVCIPKFDDAEYTAAPVLPPQNRVASGAFQGLFGSKETDYMVSLDEDGGDKTVSRNTPIEPSEGNVDVRVVMSFIGANFNVRVTISGLNCVSMSSN